MKKILSISFLIFFAGCATLNKGYYDKVVIKNAPEDLKITTTDNVTIQVQKRLIDASKGNGNPYDNSTSSENNIITESYIKLRSSEKHTLTLSSNGRSYNVTLYPKLSAGWFVVDVLFVLPAFVDYYTGNWSHFDTIDFQTQ